MIRSPFILALCLHLLFPATAAASMASQLNDWFTAQNFSTSTRPGVYETQSARYVTLGGVSYRAPIQQPFRFLTIQTPKFSAGCGGIDLYTGGFSVMNANQFVDALRAIGQNAVSLAFMLAIQIVSPQLSGIMEDIQSWANKYLSMANDSCEAATRLIGGALELFGEEKGNCTVKRMNAYGEDYNTANHKCTTGGQKTATENDGTGANRVTFTKGNLTWWVLMQNPFFRADPQFSLLIMNIVGTLIVKDAGTADADPQALTSIPFAIDNTGKYYPRFKNMVTALLLGAQARDDLSLYTCSDATPNPTACLNINAAPVTFSPSIFGQGLQGRINALVDNILVKIQGDTALTTQEIGLIGATGIPLYRFLTAASAAAGSNSASLVTVRELTSQYTALFARTILLNSLNQVLELVRLQIVNLPDGMAAAEKIKEHAQKVDNAIAGIAGLVSEDETTAHNIQTLLDQILKYEKMVMTQLAKGFMQSARWGR